MKKIINILIFLILALVISNTTASLVGREFHIASIIYWLIFLVWILYLWSNKKSAKFSLNICFILFVVAALFATVGFREFGEIWAKLSLMAMITGFFSSVKKMAKQQ